MFFGNIFNYFQHLETLKLSEGLKMSDLQETEILRFLGINLILAVYSPGDKNISILHLSCRMSDLQGSNI